MDRPARFPYQAYQQSRTLGLTRIDLILTVYAETLRELEQAQALLARGDVESARPRLARARIAVAALAAGNDGGAGELQRNFQRLYEFVLHALGLAEPARLAVAVKVLRDLQEGFQAIRQEAQELERQGGIPPLERTHLVQATV